MKKTSKVSLVFAIVALVAAIALITVSIVIGAPRVSTARYGMFGMTTYRVMDASNLPIILSIVGSALMIISCNLFLFHTKAKCCHHHHHEHVSECECKNIEDSTTENPDVKSEN